jgi:hypothetical protein
MSKFLVWLHNALHLDKVVETSVRHQFFIKRLHELGMYDKDSDYEGMLGQAVEELSATFAKQGHSGFSAVVTVGLFNQLMDEYNKQGS